MKLKSMSLAVLLSLAVLSPACRRSAMLTEPAAAEPSTAATAPVTVTSPAATTPATSSDMLAKEIQPLLGTSWFGAYFKDKKCGYAKEVGLKEMWHNQPVYSIRFGLLLNLTVEDQSQQIVTTMKRHYDMNGQLIGIEEEADSPANQVSFSAEIVGGKFVVTSKVSDEVSKREFPIPDETLDGQLAPFRLIKAGVVGASVEATEFDTDTLKIIKNTTKLIRFEDRLIGGVKTTIAILETQMGKNGMKSQMVVAKDGTVLEVSVGSMVTLKKEPEKIAKKVDATFDVFNAGLIPLKDLGSPRRIHGLSLEVTGITKDVCINDERQTWTEKPGDPKTMIIKIKEVPPPEKPLALPIVSKDEEITRWLKPSPFIQSDAPEIVKQAKEIVGDTTDSYEAACKINEWVYDNIDKIALAAMSNAVDVLKTKQGDCSEHSVLFVALCRAAGIPARECVGIGYSSEMAAFGYHGWGEVYVGKWVQMDPTWGEKLADATHIKFGLGETESANCIGNLFGSIKVQLIEKSTRKATPAEAEKQEEK